MTSLEFDPEARLAELEGWDDEEGPSHLPFALRGETPSSQAPTGREPEVPKSQLLEPTAPPEASMVTAPVAQPKKAPGAQPLTREALAKAFGPKSEGPDFADLRRKLQLAYGAASTRASVDNFLTNLGGNSSFGGGYHGSPDARQLELQRAEVPLKLAKEQQAYELNRANIAKAFAPKATDPLAGDKFKLEQEKFAEDKRAKGAAELEAKRYHDIIAGKGTPTSDELASAKAMGKAWIKAKGKGLGLTEADIDAVTDPKQIERLMGEDLPPPKPAKGGASTVHAKAGDINSVPEQYRAVVQRIISGRDKAPDPGSRFGAEILRYAAEVDPNFDSTRYGAHKGVVEQQAKDKSLVAVDVAKSHVGRARSNIPENFDSRALNRVKQVFQTNSGSDKLSAFELDLLASAHELAAVYGIGNLEGQRAIEHLLDPNQSKAQLVARLDEAEKLMEGKLEGAERQRQKYAPLSAKSSDPLNAALERGRNKGVTLSTATTKVKNIRTGETRWVSQEEAAKYRGQPKYEVTDGEP